MSWCHVQGDENMSGIRYVLGDATQPQATGHAIICHICNDSGAWGAGFVLAISARWPQPEQAYRDWYANRATNDFGLGSVQFVQVETDIWVANMIGQRDIRSGPDGPPIRYEAVDACLAKVGTQARELSASVHMPRIGCGLAGGRWEEIEPLIRKNLIERGIAVTVYDRSSTERR
jgi:O-acetyl-ADP-ribose deacetylase (regulator of RNase III)